MTRTGRLFEIYENSTAAVKSFSSFLPNALKHSIPIQLTKCGPWFRPKRSSAEGDPMEPTWQHERRIPDTVVLCLPSASTWRERMCAIVASAVVARQDSERQHHHADRLGLRQPGELRLQHRRGAHAGPVGFQPCGSGRHHPHADVGHHPGLPAGLHQAGGEERIRRKPRLRFINSCGSEPGRSASVWVCSCCWRVRS